MSGRPCKICSNPPLARFANRLLRNGHNDATVLAKIHARFPEEELSKDSVRRHRINHLEIGVEESGVASVDTARAAAPSDEVVFASAGPTRAARATPTVVKPKVTHADVSAALRKGPMTLDELINKFNMDPREIGDLLEQATTAGSNIHYRGDKFHVDAKPPAGSQRNHGFELVSDKDGWIEFGACGDQHLCSKYERLDCLNDYYDNVAHRGIKTVLNAGNWIDGESSFNKHDLLVHGMDQQMQYLANNYPRRPGVETWAITGEDHEGWWSRREGVDVGRYAENVMRHNGREDWRDVGFMECFIPLVNAASGKSSQLCLMHPGGGSAYALSYAPQKIVEGFDGGAKPAVLLIGHYHKSSYQMTRNVHTLQTGCFQDQSLFMRQKKLAAHVGGWFCRAHVDPRTGAVDEFTGSFRNYFVKDFYDNRWSEHGPVTPAKRSWKP